MKFISFLFKILLDSILCYLLSHITIIGNTDEDLFVFIGQHTVCFNNGYSSTNTLTDKILSCRNTLSDRSRITLIHLLISDSILY